MPLLSGFQNLLILYHSVVLKIRLQRVGRSKRPNYRIVVTEHTSPAISNYIQKLGYYDPLAKENPFSIDVDAVMEWIKKGAKPSNTVARLLKGDGVKGMEAYITPMKDKKKKKEVPEEQNTAPAVAEEKAEEVAPAEETSGEASSEEKA